MAQTACNRPTDASAPASAAPFTIVETGVPELQAALQSGRITSRQLVTQYLARIATYEDRINAIITVNPRALEEADRWTGNAPPASVRGPLHGIPIALKDNIHTTDIRTTGGALAFRDLMPPYDATLTKNLRDGGAIIIAKTVLTELAHWTAGAPTPMVANYTGVAGFAFNPYDPAAGPAGGDVRPAGAVDRRVELRRGHGGELLGRQRRIGHRRVDHQPVERQHARRHPSDHRPHQPLRRDPDYRGSRHGGADGADRDRRGRS